MYIVQRARSRRLRGLGFDFSDFVDNFTQLAQPFQPLINAGASSIARQGAVIQTPGMAIANAGGLTTTTGGLSLTTLALLIGGGLFAGTVIARR